MAPRPAACPVTGSVVVVEAFADVPGEAPYPGEEHYIAKAVESRRREFITARRCARQARAVLGNAPAPISRTASLDRGS